MWPYNYDKVIVPVPAVILYILYPATAVDNVYVNPPDSVPT